MVNIRNASYIKGGTNTSNFPEWDLPEIVLSGRSNVGKSTFINTLLDNQSAARVSGKPGKTQVLNFFNIDDKLAFVDVPGYGFAKVSQKKLAEFAAMIEEYITNRKNLKLVCLLVDSRHNPTSDDITMYEYLKHNNKKVLVIATKWDKLNQKERVAARRNIPRYLKFDDNDIFIPFSSVGKINIDKVWGIIFKEALNESTN